ncbi:MAG: hypothetical protein JWN76_2296 [Chitinophagaceae bacterium]|nr:hypothetical protein [Chitinophagaceae bacterium]
MPAYIIVDVHITDPASYEEYKKLTPSSIAAYEGKFIVRGGETKTLEGDWKTGRIVVLEFPTAERAMEWWNSPEYSPAKLIRQSAATTNMILAEGYQKLY